MADFDYIIDRYLYNCGYWSSRVPLHDGWIEKRGQDLFEGEERKWKKDEGRGGKEIKRWCKEKRRIGKKVRGTK